MREDAVADAGRLQLAADRRLVPVAQEPRADEADQNKDSDPQDG